MATSASQTYIARLGFQDPDRQKAKHGLACEYLFERLITGVVAPYLTKQRREQLEWYIDTYASKSRLLDESEQIFAATEAPKLLASLTEEHGLAEASKDYLVSKCINVPISNSRGYVSGFADVLIETRYNEKDTCILGEVKITPQPAEEVLQQINFYKDQLRCIYKTVRTVYILVDYECSDLQRLTQGSDVSVFRLGQRFEDWAASRQTLDTPEL